MKKLVLLVLLFPFGAFAQEKSFENYDQIVRDLSARRDRVVATQMSVSIPPERFHLSLGLAHNSSSVKNPKISDQSQAGFLLGGAMPLIRSQLYFEAFGKFYQAREGRGAESQLQQYELRFSHKEPLSFAILNLGLGTSARFLEVREDLQDETYRTPSVLLTAGLERRISNRMSLAGDIGFHRSFQEDSDLGNAFEVAFRLNCHL